MIEKAKANVCLVTDEVMPFTRGGIGAFVRNTLESYAPDFRLTVLFSGAETPDVEKWSEHYPSVRLYSVEQLQPQNGLENAWDDKFPRHAFFTKSLRVCRALIALSAEAVEFDVVEFIDWGGVGFYPIQYKLCGLWLTRAVLSVRIHCTESVLRHFEFRNPDVLHNVIYDIERKALADADIVVASLEPVADYFQSFYGFGEEWRKRVRVEAPTVLVPRAVSKSTIPSLSSNLVFSSKFQEIKRPQLFLRGALLFLARRADFKGNIVFAAFTANDSSLGDALTTIPSALLSRIKVEASLTERERSSLLSTSVVVFPNVFEAFCFAAYEASLAGAVVVLNALNPAFGSNTFWHDGLNCFKFDGTASGLADTLERAFAVGTSSLSPVDVRRPRLPYWDELSVCDLGKASSWEIGGEQDLTVFVLHRDQATALDETISAIMLEVVRVKVVVLDDASTDPSAIAALRRLEGTFPESVHVHRSGIRLGWGALLNEFRVRCSTAFVCVMPAGTTQTIGFLGALVEALTCHPNFDVVLPTSAVCDSHRAAVPTYVFHPLGEALASGELSNTYAAHMFVVRATTFKSYFFSEAMANNFEWEYLRRLALAGCRMLVWPVVDVNYLDSSVRQYETYLPSDITFNSDLVSKARQAKRGHGVACDAVRHVHSFMRAPEVDVASTIVVGTRERSEQEERDAVELETRRKFARLGVKPPRKFIDRVVDVIGWRKDRYLFHIETIAPTTVQEDRAIVLRGVQLVVEGWAFGSSRSGTVTASVLLDSGETRITFTSITWRSRLDVCLTYDLPEEMQTGFTGHIDTGLLNSGRYKIVIVFTAPSGKILNREVFKIIEIV